MASGNSGGPLVDICGRVLGINSFGSMSDGNDAEFGFAISNREIASFLRQAGVQFARTSIECKSPQEAQDEEIRRIALEQTKLEAERRANDDAHRAAMTAARDKAEQQIISERENAMAIAAILLAFAVLGAGGSFLLLNQGQADKRKTGIRLGIGGGVALIGAIVIFVARPSFSSIDDRAQLLLPKDIQATANSYKAAGQNICRIDEARSRITVSDVSDVALNWTNGGCVNGRTQFGHKGGQWSRSFVPNNEATVDIRGFDPNTGRYSVGRYLLDAATIEKAREIRKRYKIGECTADPAALAKLAAMEDEIRAILPPRPNERLVYDCGKGKASD
jgi:hypothetical protein